MPRPHSILLTGTMADGMPAYAYVDPTSCYSAPQVCRFRFSATLAPYRTPEAAREALEAAGAANIVEAAR
jgi:hypothetical protein